MTWGWGWAIQKGRAILPRSRTGALGGHRERACGPFTRRLRLDTVADNWHPRISPRKIIMLALTDWGARQRHSAAPRHPPRTVAALPGILKDLRNGVSYRGGGLRRWLSSAFRSAATLSSGCGLIQHRRVRRHLDHAAIHAENPQVDRRISVSPLQDGLVSTLRCAGGRSKLRDSVRLGRYAGDHSVTL